MRCLTVGRSTWLWLDNVEAESGHILLHRDVEVKRFQKCCSLCDVRVLFERLPRSPFFRDRLNLIDCATCLHLTGFEKVAWALRSKEMLDAGCFFVSGPVMYFKSVKNAE